MHPFFYYILVFLVLGGVGMAVANRKVDAKVNRQRWLKYFTYIIITGTIVMGIFLHFFFELACIVVLASGVELIKVNIQGKAKWTAQLLSFAIFVPVATGFLFFARIFTDPFLLFIYFQVLVFDGFCQITGQLFGRNALVPKISPAKTWEGLSGGLICCIIAACIAADWLNIGWVSIIFGGLCGLFTGLVSFCGDLLASYYKRKAGVKDYSNWLPGQGGFLDRFDSFLLTGAVYYLLYLIIFSERFNGFVK